MLRRPAALVALLLVVGCSSSGSSASSGSSSVATTTTTTTTTAPTTTTTIPLQSQASPAEAAGALMSAWRDGDRAAAATVATPQAVEALFAVVDPGPSHPEARGCADASLSPASCVYRTEVGEVQIRTIQGADGGWTVDQARVTPA